MPPAPRSSMWSTAAGRSSSWTAWASTAACFRNAANRWKSAGGLPPQAAELTGFAAGTPVVGGGGDQAASAVGNGIVEAGIVSCTLGTSGVVFAHMEQPAYDPAGRVHTFCHAVPGKWHVMGVTQGAGLSLQWFRNQLAPGAGLRRAHARSRPGAGRSARPFLAPLPDGRAHAPPGRFRPRRLDRPDRQPHPRPPHPRVGGRRLLQPARLPGDCRGLGHRRSLRARLRRRRAEPFLARASGLHSQPPGGYASKPRRDPLTAPPCLPWPVPASTHPSRSSAAPPSMRPRPSPPPRRTPACMPGGTASTRPFTPRWRPIYRQIAAL